MLNLYTLKNSHFFTIPDLGKGLPSFESLIQALFKNGRVSIVSDYELSDYRSDPPKNYMKRVGTRGIYKSNLELFTTYIKPAVNDALSFQ